MKLKHYPLFLFAILAGSASHAQTVTTFAGTGFGAGTGSGAYTGDGGAAVNAKLNSCTSVAFDGAGNVYIADRSNNVVRKVNGMGIISTFAGTGTAGYTGDGGPATAATLSGPYGVTTDPLGNVYISDRNNNVIRKVSPAGTITTFAGTGNANYGGDGGHATTAWFRTPEGLAFDNNNWVLYIADAGNHAVRLVDTMDGIRTYAGTGSGGFSGDGGPANTAKLRGPSGVAVDVYGNVYIADQLNNVIRKVSAGSANISTCAGNATVGFTGDGGLAASAQLHTPAGVSVDNAGNIYIADQGNNTIRKVNTSGVITTFAGTRTNGYLGDGGPAAAAQFSSPKNVIADGWGRIYVTDYDNNVVRLITTTTGVAATSKANDIAVYPNPSTGTFTVSLPEMKGAATVTVTDVTGKTIRTVTIKEQQYTFSLAVPAGNYLVTVKDEGSTYSQTVTIAK